MWATALRAGLWLIRSSVGRYALGGLAAAALIAVALAWFHANYVSRAEYRSLQNQLALERKISAEKDAAARADAEMAERNAERIDDLKEKADAIEVEGDDPVVWDRAAVERLQSLRR